MSDIGILGDDEQQSGGRRRAERQRRRGPGCLIALVVLAVLAGAAYWGVTTGIDRIKDQFDSAEDYPGPGTEDVTYEVKTGDTATQIGRGLKDAGVVASVDAFIAAAQGNAQSSSIQAGFYALKKEMKASDALDILIDPANLVTSNVTIPEGLRVVDIVAKLVEATGFKKAAFDKALADPAALGLPDYANGNPEGYLFPATYSFGPNEKPADMLRDMVVRWEQAATDNDLVTVLTTNGDTTAAIDALRAAGATTTLHHITLLAPVMKTSVTGPIAADAIETFPQYRAARSK